MYNKSLCFFPKLQKVNFVSTLLSSPAVTQNLKKIHAHSFNQQLFAGTLNPKVFGKYLHDDYIYLHHYALTLELIAARSAKTHPKLAKHLSSLHQDIIAGEKAMQEQYAHYFSHQPESQPGTAISAYINFLNKHVTEPELSVTLCSILACFWIYYELGTSQLAAQPVVNNPYQEWIKTYSSAEFTEATLTLAESINTLATTSDSATLMKMRSTFSQAVELELQFFDEVVIVVPQSSDTLAFNK